MNTKDKIVEQAIHTFNENGFGSVNLFELAKSLGMSRGNITYHFKNKEALLEEIAERVWQDFAEKRATNKNIPSFENLHHDVQLYYHLQKRYSFIFQDNQVLKHPLIAPKVKEFESRTLDDIKAAIAFSIQLGNMRPERVPGTYNYLALTSWMLMFFWSAQENIRGERNRKDGEKVIWSLLLPHLTEKGLASFEKFFGKKYMESLGEEFQADMNAYISF